jgi:DNA polymerase-3 subunit gamma/tau
MAKIGGAETELLQISSDERARASRTAMLFTEEEITRNLQIVLRTFDDLNYRQEQRFHLELGLLKLIHAQRLLPLEELLSGVVAGGGVRSSAPAPAPSKPAAPPARTAPASPFASTAPSASSTPAPSASPFGNSGWGSGTSPKMNADRPVATSATVVSINATERQAASSPFAPASESPSLGATENLTDGALARAPEPVSAATSTVDTGNLREAVAKSLANEGHSTASTLLGSGKWTVDGSSLRIEVAGMGKKMLALTINAAAEKIIRQELARLGAPTRFMVVPGAGSAPSGAASAAPAVAGSVQKAAMSNPLVQKAIEIFHAEVRGVIDLRAK